MAYKAPPGWWKKGDGKRMDRIQALFAQLSEEYQRVPSPFERRKSVTPTEPAQDEDE
jgi:hypothetical protein